MTWARVGTLAMWVLVPFACVIEPSDSEQEIDASGRDEPGLLPESELEDDGAGEEGEPPVVEEDPEAAFGFSAGTPGFFRIESPAGSERTWLVTPSGERTFMLGVNTVMRSKSCDGMKSYIRRVGPGTAARIEWARLSTGTSGAQTNASPYCFNSVGAFSETNDFDDTGGDSYMVRPLDQGGAAAPYSVVLNVSPRGDDRALRSEGGTVLRSGFTESRMGDPYNPKFLADLDAMVAADVAPRVNDVLLQFYYTGNEIGIFDRGAKSNEGVRDFRRWIWSDCPAGSGIDAPACARHALAAFLRDRYGSNIGSLNAKWDTSHASFSAIVGGSKRPVPYVKNCNAECRKDLQRFVHGLLKKWVVEVTTRIRAADPNHLVASPRLALGTSSRYRFWQPASKSKPDRWVEKQDQAVPTDSAGVIYCPFDVMKRDGNAGYDAVAVNVYTGSENFEKPWFPDGIHKLQSRSGLPVIVSEFSVRARISGWSNKGGAGSFVPHDDSTDDQIQRGARYREQIEQFVGFRRIIGASWHAWSDRYLASDESHQINMGIFTCNAPGQDAGERWDELDDRMRKTNCHIKSLISSITGL